MNAEMRVEQVFRFQDGRTVLAGQVTADVARVPSCRAELYVAGALRTTVQVEGEMLPNRPGHSGARSVSTKDTVPLTEPEFTQARLKFLL